MAYPAWEWWNQGHLVVKGTGYGLDVICHIGEACLRRKMPQQEIHEELTEVYGLQLSERHVSNLFKLFLALVEGRNLESQPIQDKLRKQGGILLSADGVVFDETSPPLYVLRDLLSGELLYAKRLDGAEGKRGEQIVEMFSRVAANDVPVLGILTDKEVSFVAAAKKVFPKVPHQLCQAHYLQNIVRPMEAGLSDLARGVRGVVNYVKEEEKKLKDVEATPEEKNLVRGLCKVAASAGRTRGDKLLNPTPVKRFLRLEKVAQAVREALEHPGSWPLLTRLDEVLSRLDSYQGLARFLQDQVDVARDLAHVLKEGGESGLQVKTELNCLLDELEEDAIGDDDSWCRFIKHVVGVTRRFWSGLFHCYDLEKMPSTNNAMEGFFGAIKRQQRKVTGRSSTSGGPLETCASYVLGAWSAANTHPDLVSLLQDIPPESLNLARKRLEELAKPAKEKRSIARDSDSYLDGLLNDWTKAVGS